MLIEKNEQVLGSTFKLEENEFKRLSSFIMSQFGIRLPPNKKTLLQCRLQKRIRALQQKSFKEYTDYIFSSDGLKNEVSHMIDAVSTNKTDFFREPSHFNFLLNNGISDYLLKAGKSKLTVWSAGCSSGEEPYTIAMILKEYEMSNHSFDFNILATDISDSVLQHAIVGIYNTEKTQVIPLDLKKKYLLKGKNSYEKKVRVSHELRSKIEFRKFNLLNSDYSHFGKFDIIFCRNVLIYFEREVQQRLLTQFSRVLNIGGYLFLGHSESLTGYSLPLKHLKPTIFSRIKKMSD